MESEDSTDGMRHGNQGFADTSPYRAFFHELTGHEPYPYQARLGLEDWPDLVDVPTGLGKTAAVTVAWLWKQLQRDAATPRRLVYCLPMRVLVEQTVQSATDWRDAAAAEFESRGLPCPSVHALMGGDADDAWSLRPQDPAILVGTQDMLLSRALLRGYGMSRYQWPIHFALLHNDALWVFDEVQLMGPGLGTSAQLEGFRRSGTLARPTRSLWMSATLSDEWLATIDFRSHLESATRLTIGEDDKNSGGQRVTAGKLLRPASPRLGEETAKKDAAAAYIAELTDAVLEAHKPGTQTLVILNRVGRAQDLYRRLRSVKEEQDALLLHARFRFAERTSIEEAIRRQPPGDRIIVATQAIEAGVDISSATLFTELAPWSSLVQRFGRCNRYGEVAGGGSIYWVEIDDDAAETAPYDLADLQGARSILQGLTSASIADLPAVESIPESRPIVRRRDFEQLFDTEPDLSGFDLDVSPYIRDPGTPQVQVFWRSFGDGDERPADDAPAPERWELCPASMGQIHAYLRKSVRKRKRRFFRWDGLAQKWIRSLPKEWPNPGTLLMLAADLGGYDPEIGFDAGQTRPVSDIGPSAEEQALSSSMGDDRTARVGCFISLEDHTQHVMDEVESIAGALGLEAAETSLLRRAALWHDVGKAHPAFQNALLDFYDEDTGSIPEGETLWAKSAGKGRLRYRMADGSERRLFRHELASMLAWIEHGEGNDLMAYLIAAHHGKLRLMLRALPREPAPPDGDNRRFARGIWEGDVLPEVRIGDLELPRTTLSLELMELGHGSQGPSWTERSRRLLAEMGPFQLAWLESLLRIADRRASAAEEIQAMVTEAVP